MRGRRPEQETPLIHVPFAGGIMKDFGKMMKQAQAMQAKMAKIQEELANKEIEATSGGGMVTVKVNGQQEVLAVTIDPEVFKDGDKEMLEDLIVAALNEARKKALELAQQEMSSLTGGLSIPGLF
jgi:DNA-binding YbaB/EbfC family protein